MQAMAGILFETDRLVVRPVTRDDIDALMAVFGDLAVMRWFWPERPLTRTEVERNTCYPDDDPMLLSVPGIVLLKPHLAPVGHGGVVHHAARRAELSFALAKEHWGKGLATELARGAVAAAFARPETAAVYATVNPANRPSIRVLEKCGFQFVRHIPTVDRYEYRLDRPHGRALAARP